MCKNLVSIIIPVYNVEKYLKKCLDSVINQSYKNLEIICVNDGSRDLSKDILEQYKQKDDRIIIVNKKNGGLSSARNAGLDIATGEYCYFLDSDDWIELNAIDILVDKISNNDVDVVVHEVNNVCADNDSTQLAKECENWLKSFTKPSGIYPVPKAISKSIPSITWNKLYKMSIINKYNCKFIEGLINEDEAFIWTYMIHCKNYYYLDVALYNYLRRKDSIMGQKCLSIKILDILKILEFVYKDVSTHKNINDYQEVLTSNYIDHVNYLFTILPLKYESKALNLIKKYIKTVNNDANIISKYEYLKNQRTQRKKRIIEKIFSVKNSDNCHKIVTILGLKIKFKIRNTFAEIEKEINAIREDLFYKLLKDCKSSKLEWTNFIDESSEKVAIISELTWENIHFLFKNIEFKEVDMTYNQLADYYFLWGERYWNSQYQVVKLANFFNKPLFIFEDGFLRSINTWVSKNEDKKYLNGISFTIDSLNPYFDATKASRMELMLNDKNLIISDEQKQRARACIDKIVETHLTKYNHQPIFEPKIGREGVKKVLVVDQSYGDMSIAKGLADENTFKEMLECAIKENPDADIIVKTHPDTIAGAGGYYKGLKAHDNVYTQTEAINPISLIKYVDKVYVCTTQFGFESLMCGKEVHVFGMPFYAGWGLTHDRQKCERRTNTRTLEEVFYIAYIMYSYYVNPERQCRCEIEEAMDYLLKLRDEYFALNNK